jgi:hypothetical protein
MSDPEGRKRHPIELPGMLFNFGSGGYGYMPAGDRQGAYAVMVANEASVNNETEVIGFSPPGNGFNSEPSGPRAHWRKATWLTFNSFATEEQPDTIEPVLIEEVYDTLPPTMYGFIENRTRHYIGHSRVGGPERGETRWPIKAIHDQVLRDLEAELNFAVERFGEHEPSDPGSK